MNLNESKTYGGGERRGSRRDFNDSNLVLPELNIVYSVKVKSIQSYGAFCGIVKDDGKHYRDGLLLKSRLSTERVEKVEDLVSVGQEFF